jgi:hypothetical protein
MKQSGFKRKSTKPLKRSGFKKTKCKLKKQSLKPLPKLQRECDKKYQEVGKKLMPYSLISGKPTQVIHHFYTKQSSSRLRYEIKNGIPLTFAEHFAIHKKSDPTIVAIILERKGPEWYQNLSAIKRESIKIDRLYYQKVLEDLNKLSPTNLAN